MSGNGCVSDLSDPPKRFWISHSITIDDVSTKFAEKQIVKSTNFSCVNDPALPSFYLEARFGSDVEGSLSAYLRSNGTEVCCKSIKFAVYGKQSGKLASLCTDAIWNNILATGLGFSQLCKIDGASGGQNTWNVVFEGEYTHLEPEGDAPKSLPSQLHQDWREVWDSPVCTDITFNVQQEEIKAHKIVLIARSKYFANLFGTGMKESVSNEVEVPDILPEVFKALLQFLYCGTVSDLSEVSMELLVAADKYAVDELKQLCQKAICKTLTKYNVIDALLLANRHNCKELLTQATMVFRLNFDTLGTNKIKLDQLKADPDLLLKLLR